VAVTCRSTPNRITLVVTEAAAAELAVNVALPVASYLRLVNVIVELKREILAEIRNYWEGL